jgi:hypothetical protein
MKTKLTLLLTVVIVSHALAQTATPPTAAANDRFL